MNKDLLCEALSLAVEPDLGGTQGGSEYSFSSRFEKKMNRLIRQQKKPLWRYTNTFGKRLALTALLLVLCLTALFSVSAEARAYVSQTLQSLFAEEKEVTYVLSEAVGKIGDDLEIRPYLYFNTKGRYIRMGQGLSFSYGLNGVYTQEGEKITIQRTDGTSKNKAIEGAYIELLVLSDTEIQVVKVSEAFFADQSWSWLNAGNVLITKEAYQEDQTKDANDSSDHLYAAGFKEGLFSVSEPETDLQLSPFIQFDFLTDYGTWGSEQHTDLPYSICGPFMVEGDRIICKTWLDTGNTWVNDKNVPAQWDEAETAFELQILSETELKVIKVREGFFTAIKSEDWFPSDEAFHLIDDYEWIHEGQVYINMR